MAIKLNSMKADLAKEREGEWITLREWPSLGTFDEPLKFRVRSVHSPAYQAARQTEVERLTRRYDPDPIPLEKLAEVNGSLAAKHLLLGWEGLDVPYTEEAAREALTDEAHRPLRDMVFACATRVGRRDVEFIEEAAKNSGAPSATS